MIKKLYNYYNDVVRESKKITWAQKHEVRSATIMVVVVVLILGVVFLGIDSLVYTFIKFLLEFGG